MYSSACLRDLTNCAIRTTTPDGGTFRLCTNPGLRAFALSGEVKTSNGTFHYPIDPPTDLPVKIVKSSTSEPLNASH